MISWLYRCAVMIASAISDSGISRPKPSIMTTALSVPATIRSRSLNSSSAAVGKGMSLPSTRASLTAPIGPRNGTFSAMISDADAPMIDGTSGSFCLSAEIGPAWIWTSSR